MSDKFLEEYIRKGFEAWFCDYGEYPDAIERCGRFYVLAAAQNAWETWEAACRFMEDRKHD